VALATAPMLTKQVRGQTMNALHKAVQLVTRFSPRLLPRLGLLSGFVLLPVSAFAALPCVQAIGNLANDFTGPNRKGTVPGCHRLRRRDVGFHRRRRFQKCNDWAESSSVWGWPSEQLPSWVGSSAKWSSPT
jgi:hypothetical protein